MHTRRLLTHFAFIFVGNERSRPTFAFYTGLSCPQHRLESCALEPKSFSHSRFNTLCSAWCFQTAHRWQLPLARSTLSSVKLPGPQPHRPQRLSRPSTAMTGISDSVFIHLSLHPLSIFPLELQGLPVPGAVQLNCKV